MNESFTEFLVYGVPLWLLGFFLGPAFGYLRQARARSMTLSQVHAEADAVVGPPVIRRPRQRHANADSGDEALALIAIGVIGSVLLYLKYRTEVILIVLAVAVLVCLAATFVLLTASRRRVIVPRRREAWAFVVPLGFTMIGILDVAFLWTPPVGGSLLEESLKARASGQGFGGMENLAFVFYQLLGAATFIFLAFGCMCFSISTVTAIYISGRAAGMPIWSLVYRGTRGARDWWFPYALLVVSALSVAMCGGWLYDWLAGWSGGHTSLGN